MNAFCITYFKNFYDTNVSMYDTVSWDALVELFSEHTVTESKDDIMFNLCSFKDREVGIRCADNVVAYYGLVLDYDGNGATLDKIVERFADFKHLGYTSFNHKLKGVDKFRVVLPFDKPCSKDEWELRKEGFLEFAGIEVDRSSVSQSRSFYLPACPAAGQQYAFNWALDGVTLDWECFVPPVKPVYVKPVIDVPTSMTDMQRALNELQKHVPNMDNEMRYWIVRAVAKELGADLAIEECQRRWPDYDKNGKYVDQVKKLKDTGPGMGAIVNKIKKFNPYYASASIANYKIAVLKAEIEQIKNRELV